MTRLASLQRACKTANRLWFLTTLSSALSHFTNAFRLIGVERYYEAWCELEQCEIDLDILLLNPFIEELGKTINFLNGLTKNWQSLYPYKVFFSPEMVIHREECSICGEQSGPWSKCQHRAGKVYCGHRCVRIVRKMEFRAISLVLEPVQKYSVARTFKEDGSDQFRYDAVKWVHDRLRSPFDAWSAHHTTRLRDHKEFFDLTPESDCPCDSSRSYQSCCATRDGVISPHIQISFESPPPKELDSFIFFNSGSSPAKDPAGA